MQFELLDSDYNITFEKSRVIIRGFPVPPMVEGNYSIDMLSSADKPKYSTFYIAMEVPNDPENFQYDFYRTANAPNFQKTFANGILSLEFPEIVDGSVKS
jgi:hypothetical protein